MYDLWKNVDINIKMYSFVIQILYTVDDHTERLKNVKDNGKE